jgi:uncharacterized repeat protein (TIGR01451 family)
MKNISATKNTFCLSAAALALVFLLAAYSPAHAAGTLSGTVITNTASISALNAEPVSYATTATVIAVYGITTGSEPADGNTTTGGFTYYKIKFKNNGNTTDTIKLNMGAQTFSANAGTTVNWSVEADDADPYVAALNWNNSGTTKAAQGGDYVSMTLAPNAQATFTVKITAASDAGDTATMSVPVSLQTLSAPTAQYTYNTVPYGGLALAARTAGASGSGNLTTMIQGAIISLVKNYVITIPTGYTGVAGTPVPGSKITYTITYSNSGASNAAGVFIIDPIPANTHFFTSGSITKSDPAAVCDFNTSNTDSVTCNVGTVNTGASGTIQYSVTID